MSDRYVWLALFLLGCYHGLNPAMGWLFAVALGFQEKRTSAVLRAIVPLTLGTPCIGRDRRRDRTSADVELPHKAVHYAAAAILIGFGLYRLVRARHLAGWACA